MKPLSLILLLVVLAAPAFAQPGRVGNSDGVSVFAERGDHATIELSPKTRSSFRLSGTLLDDSNRPVVGAEIRIVRYDVKGAAGTDQGSKKLVPLDDLKAELPPYVIKQTISLVTGADGTFSLDRSLPPGRYSLQVDWKEMPDATPFVRWDLRWVDEQQQEAPKG